MGPSPAARARQGGGKVPWGQLKVGALKLRPWRVQPALLVGKEPELLHEVFIYLLL